MNRLQHSVRKTILSVVGKALTLCGVALTFAACYGVQEPNAPTYWSEKNAEQMLFGAETTQEKEYKQPEISSIEENHIVDQLQQTDNPL